MTHCTECRDFAFGEDTACKDKGCQCHGQGLSMPLEKWEVEFDEKFTIESNARTLLLRYTDASLIKAFIRTQLNALEEKHAIQCADNEKQATLRERTRIRGLIEGKEQVMKCNEKDHRNFPLKPTFNFQGNDSGSANIRGCDICRYYSKYDCSG